MAKKLTKGEINARIKEERRKLRLYRSEIRLKEGYVTKKRIDNLKRYAKACERRIKALQDKLAKLEAATAAKKKPTKPAKPKAAKPKTKRCKAPTSRGGRCKYRRYEVPCERHRQ